MKKHLIAAAVAAAVVAPAAMAQSTVTVYGIIDAGFQNFDNGADSYTRSTNNALATSRLGFRGSEDLGGGLKANFQLEATLNPSEGGVGSTTANQTFNREAWVGVSGGFGELRVGRQDVTFGQDIDSGASQAGNLVFAAVGGSSGELGGDVSGVIKYITPKFNGFNAELGYSSGNATGAASDGKAEQSGIFLQYMGGPLRVMAAYSKTEAPTSAAEQDMTRFGISYDFGMASVGYTYTQSDVNLADDLKISMVSAKVPLANGIALHGLYGTGKVSGTSNKGDGYTLAVTKALSKRTTLYAAYASVDNDPAGTFTLTSTTNSATGQVAGVDTDSISVGIVHSF